MASDLPSDFDVVVLGTGLPESILAAAFSRNGYKVLHVDRNDYYSSNWASFNVEGIEKWKKKNEQPGNEEMKGTKIPELKEEENCFPVPQFTNSFTKITSQYHIPDNLENNSSKQKQSDEVSSTETGSSPITSPDDSEQVVEGQFEDKTEDDSELKGQEANIKVSDTKPPQKIWTASEIKDNWRRFNLDLVPKVLYCSGQMVDLLIVSDVAKYCEFRTVSQILTLLNGHLEKVPCSRADVFGSKKVSMLEKRLLMKFLTFCAEYDKHSDEYLDFVGKPFKEFLSFRKLTPNIHHYVYHSIAMATEATTTEEGLKNTQHFLQSLGRYGNTAFLFPLYGSGEIPQGFCRLCAVFGGVYCLQMSATHIITDKENKCTAVYTTEGQRIDCKHLVLGPSYIPEEFEKVTTQRNDISRAVLITNKSVFPSENLELSMMHLLPEDDPNRAVTVLELPPSSMVCPRDTFVVHLTRKGSGDPEADLSQIIKTLFKGSEQTDINPCILWSLFFSHTDQSSINPSDSLPSNVHLLPGPGTDIDMDKVVDHAKKIWEKICPDEDFLPKPPNPEDIIYVDDAETKVGEGTENAFEDASEEDGKSQAEGETRTEVSEVENMSRAKEDSESNGKAVCQDNGHNEDSRSDKNSGNGTGKEPERVKSDEITERTLVKKVEEMDIS